MYWAKEEQFAQKYKVCKLIFEGYGSQHVECDPHAPKDVRLQELAMLLKESEDEVKDFKAKIKQTTPILDTVSYEYLNLERRVENAFGEASFDELQDIYESEISGKGYFVEPIGEFELLDLRAFLKTANKFFQLRHIIDDAKENISNIEYLQQSIRAKIASER